MIEKIKSYLICIIVLSLIVCGIIIRDKNNKIKELSDKEHQLVIENGNFVKERAGLTSQISAKDIENEKLRKEFNSLGGSYNVMLQQNVSMKIKIKDLEMQILDQQEEIIKAKIGEPNFNPEELKLDRELTLDDKIAGSMTLDRGFLNIFLKYDIDMKRKPVLNVDQATITKLELDIRNEMFMYEKDGDYYVRSIVENKTPGIPEDKVKVSVTDFNTKVVNDKKRNYLFVGANYNFGEFSGKPGAFGLNVGYNVFYFQKFGIRCSLVPYATFGNNFIQNLGTNFVIVF